MSVYKRPLRSDELWHAGWFSERKKEQAQWQWDQDHSQKGMATYKYQLDEIDRKIADYENKLKNPPVRSHPGDADLYRHNLAELKKKRKALIARYNNRG
jgi:hypothetical protein